MKTTTLLSFCFFPLILFAQIAPPDTTTAKAKTNPDSVLTELVVTAFRTESSAFNTPEAISILGKKQLDFYQPRTTPEALMNQNGVFVQKTNHGGGSPFLRGLTGNQTLLLIDGIRLNNATFRYGPNQYFNTIDIFSLQRLEILRGSGSVAYGSDALGGTIQAFTREPVFRAFSEKNSINGQFFGKLMSQNMEQTARADASFSGKNIAFLGGLTYRNFGDLVGGDTTGKQSPTAYDELNFDLKAKFRLSPDLILTLAHQNIFQDSVPVFHQIRLGGFSQNQVDAQKRQLSYARLERFLNKKHIKNAVLTASWQNTEEKRRSQRKGSSTLRLEDDATRSLGLMAHVVTPLSIFWSANSGVEFYDDFVESARNDFDEKTNTNTPKRGLYPNDSRFSSLAFYSLHEWRKNNWTLTGGARLNYFSIKINDETLGQTTISPAAAVWNAGILRGVGDFFNVFFSINTAFSAPNVDDLGTLGIDDFLYEIPNFDLKPERSTNYQVGWKYKTPRLSGETFIYRNNLKNLITRVRLDTQKISGVPVFYKENIESGYVQGFETQWFWQMTDRFSVDAHLAYAFGDNITKNEPLRRIPPINGRLAFNFKHKKGTISAECLAADAQTRLAQGDRDDNRIPKGGTPSWAVFNIYGDFLWRNWRAQASIQNIFNTDYRTHGSGVNGIGRAASLALSWAF